MWVHNADAATNAASQWPLIVAVCVVLTAIMTVTVCLRLYVRAIMVKAVGVDDYVMIFCMVSAIITSIPSAALMVYKVCGIIYNGLCIGQSRYGLGLPISQRPVINLNEYSEV